MKLKAFKQIYASFVYVMERSINKKISVQEECKMFAVQSQHLDYSSSLGKA